MKYGLTLFVLFFLLPGGAALAAGPTFSGTANFAKEAGGEVYCGGGDTTCLTFMTDAVSYLVSNPGSTITVTGVEDACYNVTGADYSGPSGDLGLRVDGYTSCTSDHSGQAVSLVINDPPPPSGELAAGIIGHINPKELLVSANSSAQPTFDALDQLGFLLAGIIIGGIILGFLAVTVVRAARTLSNKRRRTVRQRSKMYPGAIQYDVGGYFTRRK